MRMDYHLFLHVALSSKAQRHRLEQLARDSDGISRGEGDSANLACRSVKCQRYCLAAVVAHSKPIGEGEGHVLGHLVDRGDFAVVPSNGWCVRDREPRCWLPGLFLF
jgi:hypothetical protein